MIISSKGVPFLLILHSYASIISLGDWDGVLEVIVTLWVVPGRPGKRIVTFMLCPITSDWKNTFRYGSD